jgi:hypothetical protein
MQSIRRIDHEASGTHCWRVTRQAPDTGLYVELQ